MIEGNVELIGMDEWTRDGNGMEMGWKCGFVMIPM
jgi:hypothetical protein